MLINCPKCTKSFEVNDDLIPKDGRLVQCGNCEHKWHFINNNKDEISKNENITEPKKQTDSPKAEKNYIKNNQEEKQILINDNDDFVDNFKDDKTKIKNTNKNNINYFKYFIIIIISLIAFIIIIDTFKSKISSIFPQIDYLFNNLYETLIDVSLFFKDLIN